MAFDLGAEQIEAAEKELGCRLPLSYRQAMMANNGGTIILDREEWQLYPILDRSDRKRLVRTSNHILRETKVAGEWRGWPKNAIAIAANDFGDLLLFLRGDAAVLDDLVHMFLHETGETEPVARFAELRRGA